MKTGKEKFYSTAQATISCAHFKAGDFVKVEFYGVGENGISWYCINETQDGPIPTVCYPETHLTRFVI